MPVTATPDELDYSLIHAFVEGPVPAHKPRESAEAYAERVLRHFIDLRPSNSITRYERYSDEKMDYGIGIAVKVAAQRHPDPHTAAHYACVYADMTMVLAEAYVRAVTTSEGVWSTWGYTMITTTADPNVLDMVDALCSTGKFPPEELFGLLVGECD